MPSTITWSSANRGYYTARLNGKYLEVRRNSDGTDPRRYIALIDGKPWPTPCWTLNEAKTRAIRWAHGEIDTPAPAGSADSLTQALVPYQPPPPLSPPPVVDLPTVTFGFRIAGVLTVEDLGCGLAHLSSAVDLLRELGSVDCDVDLPPHIKI